jgi:hypothetical protein
MLTSGTLRSLALKRLAEASALLEARCWDGAYYLAGYSAECALKAIIADQFPGNAIPDKRRVENTYTHSLPRLVELAGLRPSLDRESSNGHFVGHWEILKDWNEHSRYREWSEDDARAIVDALADPQNGILRWIREHW